MLLRSPAVIHGVQVNNKDLNRTITHIQSGVPLADRRMSYTTPQGTHVVVTLYGFGTLAGTKVDPDGALELIYNDTTATTAIIARTSGGTGRAPIRLIRNANVNPTDFSGVGNTLVNLVRFPSFDLVNNGIINLAGGVGQLQLNSVGSNTQIELRALPASSTATLPSNAQVETLQFVNAGPSGGTQLAGVGGFTVPGSAASTSSSGSSASSNTVTNLATGQSATLANGQVLAGTGGLAVPGAANTGATTTKVPPIGVSIQIRSINGIPNGGPQLQDAQIVGFDPTTNNLIKFNAVTGNPIGVIPLPPTTASVTAVNLGRANGNQVILVGRGQTISAYSVLTDQLVGQFSTADLAPSIKTLSGIALTETRSILLDASTNTAIAINLNASLASGQAVAAGAPFTPTRDLFYTGGATGVAGLPDAYFTAAAHFDTFQPNNFETGVQAATTTHGTLAEASRTAISTPKSIVPAGPPIPTPPQAFGSIDQNLAYVTSASNGTNTVTLYTPQTIVSSGTLTLHYPNRLTALTESFHPELAGSALINVDGAVNFIHGVSFKGLVFNDRGFLNQISAAQVNDSTIVGLPVNKVEILSRSNTTILSTYRLVGERGGVTLNSSLKPLGPFELP
jgi:hypothetical protein